MKNINIKLPNAQLPITLKHEATEFGSYGINAPTLVSSINYEYTNANIIPKNCAKKYKGANFHCNLFYLLMHVQIVTPGFKLPPLTGPLIIIPTRIPAPMHTSAHY